MNPLKLRMFLSVIAAALVFSPQLFGSMVLQMDLDTLCARAQTIARGKVVLVTPGTTEVGGAEFDTRTYTVAVTEVLKGEVPEVKGVALLEIKMVASPKTGAGDVGTLRRFSKFPEMPDLQVGQEYLLMTTPPSGATGLSTTVGLGQGCFVISTEGRGEVALNLVDNQGLFNGPVGYTDLVSRINQALGQ